MPLIPYRNAEAHNEVKTEVVYSNQVIKMWTYDQLEFLTLSKLRQRAMDMRDQVDSTIECPRIPADHESLVRWILDLQIKITGHKAHDFGVPRNVYERARDRSPFRFRPETKHPHLYAEDRVADGNKDSQRKSVEVTRGRRPE
jgi:hypothetical protein